MVPRPETGGGGNVAIVAPLIPAYSVCRLPTIFVADSSLPRYFDGLITGNTRPLLDEFIRPVTLRPGNSGVCSTPGWRRAISPISCTTFAVRSSEAPGGNCTMLTR